MTTSTGLVSADELKAMIDAAACRVVDCRFNLMQPHHGREEYIEGHISGAVYADLDRDLASPVTTGSGRHPLPDLDKFQQLLNSWGIDNDTQVVVYDHANGAIASRLWWLLRWLGHEKVAVLNGGIAAWINSGSTLTTEAADHAHATFVADPDSNMIATTDDIVAALESAQPLNLVDARDPPRFNGEAEPIDSVAGHIPGALNLPFLGTVNSDGTWRGKDELAQSWEKLLAGRPEAPPVAMCGSGVTACHLLVSAHLLGLKEPRLYVGSWSEWIRDESRPVAVAN